MGATIFAIIVLLIVVGILVTYNININKKIQTFSTISQKITSLNALQNFMDILGEDVSSDDKIENLNNVIIEKYDIKYSTIVTFDGQRYSIKTTNVDENYREVLSNLHTNETFKESIETATTKYVTVTAANPKLPYQLLDGARCKSAMFFPLYMDNVYIGYWIIESEKPRAFENMDTSILEVVKENIIKIIKGIEYQNTIESTVKIDQFSGLFTIEYLYGKGRKELNQYATSAMCMFNIVNIEEINATNRKLGNKIITEISKQIKDSISANYIFVRYMGPKFVIAFGGVENEAVKNFLADVKNTIEEIEIKYEIGKKIKTASSVSPKINFAITTYYKGTPLEGTLQKLEDFLVSKEMVNKNEVNII